MRSGSGFSLGATPAGDVGWQAAVVAKQFYGNVGTLGYMGSATALVIEGLAVLGEAYVVSVANGVGVLATAAVGDVWEYDGAAWIRIAVGVGGFVDAMVALVANVAGVLVAPLANGVDEEKLCLFDGTSLTPLSKTSPSSGDSLVISDNGSARPTTPAGLESSVVGGTSTDVLPRSQLRSRIALKVETIELGWVNRISCPRRA